MEEKGRGDKRRRGKSRERETGGGEKWEEVKIFNKKN